MSDHVFVPGKLGATDQARFLVLDAQRKTVGLDDTQRDEFHALKAKLNLIDLGTSAAE